MNLEELVDESLTEQLKEDLVTSAEKIIGHGQEFGWMDLLENMDQLEGEVQLIKDLLFLGEDKKRDLLIALIDEIVDRTDGWGPDGLIDPIIKSCARAFLKLK